MNILYYKNIIFNRYNKKDIKNNIKINKLYIFYF